MQRFANNRAFTLVEIMVATVLFGIVMIGIYSVFLSIQRTSVKEQEIIDTQQDLRVAMDMMINDIRMAGALIPSGLTSVADGSDATTLNLVGMSEEYRFAQLIRNPDPSVDPDNYTYSMEIPENTSGSTNLDFYVLDVNSKKSFNVGDSVRIIRPQSGDEPLSAAFQITALGADDDHEITLNGISTGAGEAIQYAPGDIVAMTTDTTVNPETLNWALADLDGDGDNELFRRKNSTADADRELMAENITSLQLTYLLDDGSEIDNPSDLDPYTGLSHLPDVRAVRVTITAQVANQFGEERTRSLTSLAQLRND